MTSNKREEYIKYFTHMQEEHNKIPLGGMAWDDVAWYVHDATETDKCFTRKELAEMFPDLLGHIAKEKKIITKKMILPDGFTFTYTMYDSEAN